MKVCRHSSFFCLCADKLRTLLPRSSINCLMSPLCLLTLLFPQTFTRGVVIFIKNYVCTEFLSTTEVEMTSGSGVHHGKHQLSCCITAYDKSFTATWLIYSSYHTLVRQQRPLRMDEKVEIMAMVNNYCQGGNIYSHTNRSRSTKIVRSRCLPVSCILGPQKPRGTWNCFSTIRRWAKLIGLHNLSAYH